MCIYRYFSGNILHGTKIFVGLLAHFNNYCFDYDIHFKKICHKTRPLHVLQILSWSVYVNLDFFFNFSKPKKMKELILYWRFVFVICYRWLAVSFIKCKTNLYRVSL